MCGMRQRVGALIIKGKKLLLVTGEQADYYWTPGGTVDAGETDAQTLARELSEELGLRLKSYKSYIDLEFPKDNVRSHFYLVEIDGEIKPGNEISKIRWYSKSDFKKGQPVISPWLNKVIPKLIEEKFL